jgi:hypothetical protein
MRVYLPSTLPALAELLQDASIGPPPIRGFAVTPALREWYSAGDIEELEYVALMQAARASLRLLLADPDAPRRRVVLAAEVPDDKIIGPAGFDEPALVEIKASITMRDVVSGHVDDRLAASDIADAVDALPAADDGDDDAQFTVDGAEGYELMWYATQELQHLTG